MKKNFFGLLCTLLVIALLSALITIVASVIVGHESPNYNTFALIFGGILLIIFYGLITIFAMASAIFFMFCLFTEKKGTTTFESKKDVKFEKDI